MMRRYNSKTIYSGNLIKWCDKSKSLYKDNVLFLYDEDKDVFYSYLDTFNLFLSKDLDNLHRDELEIIKKKIARHTYRYGYSDRRDEIVVDEESIRIFIEGQDKVNRL